MAYADKRAAQRLGPMDARFASWDRRHPTKWSVAERRAVRARADRLEADVCRAAGVAPEDVRRLRLDGEPRCGPPGRCDRDDDAARLPLGRRRAVGGTSARPVPGHARDGGRRAAGALAGARRPECGGLDRRAISRTRRDAGHVRWRDAGHRRQCRRRWCSGTRTATRSSALLELVAPGQRAGRPRRQPVGRQGARHPSAWPMRSPRPAARSASSSRRARGRSPAGSRPRRASAGSSSRPGAPRRWPSGSAGSSARPTPNGASRRACASMELDKLALYRGTEPITPDDVRGPRPRGDPGLGLGVHRRGRRAAPRPGARLARPAARDDPGAGPPGRAPSAGSRADRDRRPAGGRRASARRRQGDGRRQRVPDGAAARAGQALDDGRARSPRSTACSSSTRWSREHPGRSLTRRSVGWRSACG